MTVEEIAKRIENPELCSLQEVQALENLIQKYPYAQTLPILLLQTLGRTKSFDFEDQLKQHAFRVSDRVHLYYLINQNATKEPTAPEVNSPVIRKEKEVESVVEQEIFQNEPIILEDSVPVEETAEEPVEETLAGVEEIIVESTEPIAENKPAMGLRLEMELTTDNSQFASFEVEEMSFEPVQIDFDVKDIEALHFDESPVQEEIAHPVEAPIEIEETVSEGALEELVEIEEKNVPVDVSAETPTVTSEPIEQKEVETQDEIRLPQEDQEILVVQPISIEHNVKPIALFDPTIDIDQIGKQAEVDKIQPSTFHKEISLDLITPSDDVINDELTSQALSQSYPLVDEAITFSADTDEFIVYQSIGNERSFVDWLKVSAITNSEEYQVKQRTNEIVEKFIKEEPKITRITKTAEGQKKATEFFKVSKIAKASLSETDMPVSETLAEIFEAQGNYLKAIDAYQQLMLLIPEKKSFFADQIKKLKKK